MREINRARGRTPGAVNTRCAGERRSGARRLRRVIAGTLLAAVVVAPATAQAAGAPNANTGAAREVSYSSAVLAGTVNPSGSSTSYYFQYGPTRAYGGQTAIASAGSGSGAVPARLAISGLQPLSVYHYRLVAVNGAGVSNGGDQTFQTTRVPLSLQILATPNPVVFGGTTTIQGTLSGTGNGNRAVVLQANAFPFTAGFQTIGNPELTSPTGSFIFTLPGLAQSTQFRVLTTTNTPILSPVTTENVAVRISSHVARTKRAGFARIYGTVTPAVNGSQVGVLRIARGHGVLAGGTILHPSNATSSKFSRVVHVHKGVYRVLVRVLNLGVVSNYGSPLVIR